MSTPADAALVAGILTGAWRVSPPPCDLTLAEIERVTPLLTMSGGTGLGWRRVKEMPVAAEAATLRGSAQLLALEERVNQIALSEVCALLNSAGVTPMIFKGWAAARSYPESWVRPYGDFDLLVRETDLAKARSALSAAATRSGSNDDFAMPFGPRGHCSVDLHHRLDSYYAADTEALFARARSAAVAGGTLLMPSPEDHLRLCAIHMFRHGAWRPLWLCDVAAMSEAAGGDFDWGLCLGNRPAAAAWTAAAVVLAHRLLGAHCDHLPPRVRNQSIPGWLEATVLRHWQNPHGGHFVPASAFRWRDPAASLKGRWADPITATIWSGGFPSSGPRLPWKVAHCLMAIGRGVKRRVRRSGRRPSWRLPRRA